IPAMGPMLRLLAAGSLLACFAARAAAQTAPAPTPAPELTVEPAEVVLRHADDRQRLLVSLTRADGSGSDLSPSASFTSDDPAVAAVSPQGVVAPRAAGRTVIRVTAAGLRRDVAVTVQDAARRPASFAHDVMPLLARA